MDLGEAAFFMGGGLVAGFINTVAGGGSIITLPILMFSGMGADVANGTNRVAILLQNVAATVGFRSQGVNKTRVAGMLAIPACLGALLGAWVAVSLDPLVLKRVFGGVLGLLAVVVLLRPGRWTEGSAEGVKKASSLSSWLVFFGIGLYGGFVQAGVGFLFLIGLVMWMGYDLVHANAVKVLTVLFYTGVALLVFVAKGHVEWIPGLTMAVGNMAGGAIASVYSVKRGVTWVRGFLVLFALISAVKLLFW